MTRSESIIVFNLWAIVRTVQSLNLSRIVSWISVSVLSMNQKNIFQSRLKNEIVNHVFQLYFWSTLAVASSNTSMRFCLRIARAKHMSCLWPTEKFEPPSVMLDSSPAASSFTVSLSLAPSREFHKASSLYCPKGSKFLRKEPENKTGSCGMIAILDRRSWRPIVLLSIPSIITCPSGSANLNSDAISEDFPAPVRPTIPI